MECRDDYDHAARIFVSCRKWSLQSAVHGGDRPGSLLLLPRVLADDRWTHV